MSWPTSVRSPCASTSLRYIRNLAEALSAGLPLEAVKEARRVSGGRQRPPAHCLRREIESSAATSGGHVERALVAARRRTSRPQSNSRSIQGQFRVPAGWVQGGYSGTSPGDRYGSQARTRQARRLRAGVEVRAPSMATDHAASVVAGTRNVRTATGSIPLEFRLRGLF